MSAALFWQISRYGAVGLSSVVVYLGLLWMLLHGSLLSVPVANAVAYAAATLLNYLLNFYWSFKSRQSHTYASIKFIAIVIAGVMLNTISVNLAVTTYGISALWAAACFAFLWPFISFSAQKFWAFKA